MKPASFAIALAISVSLTGCFSGRAGFEYRCEATDQNCVNITLLDYRPQSGNYDINWPGPPRRLLTYSDVKHFVLDLSIDRPAPSAFSITFDIEEDRWWGWDRLGRLTANFAADSTTPTITYPAQCCGANRVPAGTPNPLVGPTFWIGCTQAGKIKANGEHGDDHIADVRLKRSNTQGNVLSGNRSKTVVHKIRCITASGSPGPSGGGSPGRPTWQR